MLVQTPISWYEWDGKDGEGQKTNRSSSKMKAAGFAKAISFNLQVVIVLYEPASVEELALSIGLTPDVFVLNLSLVTFSTSLFNQTTTTNHLHFRSCHLLALSLSCSHRTYTVETPDYMMPSEIV